MYAMVTMPLLITSTSLSEHVEHATGDGKTAGNIDTRYHYRERSDPHDELVARTYLQQGADDDDAGYRVGDTH